MPFPEAEILTTWPGPAEYPLSEDGAWLVYGNRFPFYKGVGGISNGTEFAVNGQYWTREAYQATANGGILDAFGCPGGGGLGAANESWRIVAWLDDPNSGYGYLSGYGGGIGQSYFFRRYDGGFTGSFFVGIGTGAAHNISPVMLGLRITPTRVEQWSYYSGAWNLIQYANDTTYRGVFYVALEAEGQGCVQCVGFGCFGAGVKNRQHMYRWTRAQPGVTV